MIGLIDNCLAMMASPEKVLIVSGLYRLRWAVSSEKQAEALVGKLGISTVARHMSSEDAGIPLLAQDECIH
jgi:hypothetical protein